MITSVSVPTMTTQEPCFLMSFNRFSKNFTSGFAIMEMIQAMKNGMKKCISFGRSVHISKTPITYVSKFKIVFLCFDNIEFSFCFPMLASIFCKYSIAQNNRPCHIARGISKTYLDSTICIALPFCLLYT